jgi:hypothetical protein
MGVVRALAPVYIPPVMRIYYSEEAAFARVERLREVGVWPGVVRLPHNRWRLTYDPPAEKGAINSHGYLAEP